MTPDPEGTPASSDVGHELPAIALILMQKNEGALLRSWFGYHVRFTLPHHIHIVDNGSSDPVTIAVLKSLEQAGANVDYSRNSSADYQKKHEIVQKVVLKLQKAGQFDFVIPLDCDEFLACISSERIPQFKVPEIYAELTRYSNAMGPLVMAGSFYNNPRHLGSFFFSRELAVFFARDEIKSIDHGYHSATTLSGADAVQTNIVVMHFQYKRLELAKVQATEKLKLRVPNFSEEMLRSFTGTGSHMIKYFVNDSQGYLDMFHQPPDGGGGFQEFRALMASPEVAFPVDLYFATDRYADYRQDMEARDWTRRAISEGLSFNEILFVHKAAAASRQVAIYRDSALARLLLECTDASFAVFDIMRPTGYRPIAAAVEAGDAVASRVTLRIFDIGAVDDLGYPTSPSPEANRYSKDAAALLRSDTDLVVVSGRYRVSVTLNSLRHVEQDSQFIIANFWSRPHYHHLLRFLDVVDTEADAVLLRPGRVLDIEELERSIGRAENDPR